MGRDGEQMAAEAAALGHDDLTVTDHSSRLAVAKGLTATRLREQLDVVVSRPERLDPDRIVDAWPVERRLDWTGAHRAAA